MSKDLEERKQRAAQISKRQVKRPAEEESEDAPASPRKAAPRAKPVRVTTDLPPQNYRQLVAYCAELAETLGRAKVPHAEVIRSLIAQLDSDASLQSVIADAVQVRLSK